MAEAAGGAGLELKLEVVSIGELLITSLSFSKSFGGGTGKGGFSAGFEVENLDALEEKNEPIPTPHEPTRSLASAAVVLVTLAGREDESSFTGTGGGGEDTGVSGLGESTGTLSTDGFDGEVERCAHRPRMPSTALKNPVDPAVSVREMASRVGASCWSSFSSWMPSERRNDMSAMALGFSVHGCLRKCKLALGAENASGTYRGSMMSNNMGSVIRCHTSNAFVRLNSAIQTVLKSSIEFGSLPIYICYDHPLDD